MAETIKEFLVGLGYSVDGASESKFLNSVGSATKTVGYLGLSVTAAATAVGAAVTKIAANFDTIYYTAQRTQASVQNLKSVGYAVAQLGGSYSGALASIENFAQKMRSNPGIESLANKLGVATRENGKLRETTSIVQDLTKALAKRPPHIALQYLDLFGIDERTYNAMRSGDFQKFADEYAEKSRRLGVDQKKAAEIGRDLTRAWYALGATGELIGAKLEQTLGRSMASFVKDIDDFLIKNAGAIVSFFTKLGEVVGELSSAFKTVVTTLTPLWEGFDELAKRFTGQHGLTLLVEGFIALKLATWLWGVAAAITGVGSAAGGAMMGGALARFFGLLGAVGLGAAGVAGLGYGAYALNESDKDFHARKNAIERPGGRNPFAAIDERDAKRYPKDTRSLWEKRPQWMGGKPAPAAEAAAGTSISRYGSGGRRARITPEQAGEMRSGIEQSAKDLGISAEDLATVISYETGGTMHPWQKGPKTQWGQHRGLIQWGEPQARKYGVDENTSITDQMKAVTRYLRDRGVRPGHGILDVYSAINAGYVGKYGASDAANGGAPGTVADKVRTMGAHRAALNKLGQLSAGGAYSPPYNPFSGLNAGSLATAQSNAALIGNGIQPGSTPALGTGAATDASTNVEMNQRTEITVLGGSDPVATAGAVGDAQRGVNGGLLRNMTGAVR